MFLEGRTEQTPIKEKTVSVETAAITTKTPEGEYWLESRDLEELHEILGFIEAENWKVEDAIGTLEKVVSANRTYIEWVENVIMRASIIENSTIL